MADEQWTQVINFWMRWAATALPLLAFLHFRFSVFVSVFLLALTRRKPTLSDIDFIDRSGLETKLLEKLKVFDFKTVLLYGERGSGKSSLVEHALKDRWGVVFIDNKNSTRKEAMEEMEEKLSKRIDWLGRSSQDSDFLECVFSWCWFIGFEPVVVISLERGETGIPWLVSLQEGV